MKDKPLTDKEFEQCKLIANTKHMDDLQMVAIASWSYEQYLLSRWFMKRNATTTLCIIDPSHSVREYYRNAKVFVDVRNGDEHIVETGDIDDYECQECLGRKTQSITDEGHVHEFEHLQEN